MVASTVRIFAPLVASSLFAVSVERNVLGGTMIYWFLWVFVAIGVFCSFQLPRRLKSDDT